MLSLMVNYDIYEFLETLVDLNDAKENVDCIYNVIKQLRVGEMKAKHRNLSHWFIQRQMWQDFCHHTVSRERNNRKPNEPWKH